MKRLLVLLGLLVVIVAVTASCGGKPSHPAEGLFRQADELRLANEYEAAIQVYQSIQEQYRGTPVASSAEEMIAFCYYDWAERQGALRMPTETLLYHLTRLNHMVASCVGCGLCESACPSKIPLTTIFRAVGDGVQEMLDYVPGRSLEDELPLLVDFTQSRSGG